MKTISAETFIEARFVLVLSTPTVFESGNKRKKESFANAMMYVTFKVAWDFVVDTH